ncbi:hypothetical protein Dsin_023332 [Dipteronia sinensis]|uniref:HMA domain-containing protein n=1 Tax=Dipteronia sinensis TaxID=43782 RepID=A0AAE0E1Z7_9ROSI|nr:hypothetical protein Dsin_023332 [Dipteronia sinensis]
MASGSKEAYDDEEEAEDSGCANCRVQVVVPSSFLGSALPVIYAIPSSAFMHLLLWPSRMKQKIIIKVQVKCEKCRSKAMKIAAGDDGVISVAWEGEDKNKVVVIGDGVDAATLARNLSKKLGFADLLLVEEVKEKKEEKKEEKKDEPSSSLECQLYKSVVVYEDDCTSPCNIM